MGHGPLPWLGAPCDIYKSEVYIFLYLNLGLNLGHISRRQLQHLDVFLRVGVPHPRVQRRPVGIAWRWPSSTPRCPPWRITRSYAEAPLSTRLGTRISMQLRLLAD